MLFGLYYYLSFISIYHYNYFVLFRTFLFSIFRNIFISLSAFAFCNKCMSNGDVWCDLFLSYSYKKQKKVM